MAGGNSSHRSRKLPPEIQRKLESMMAARDASATTDVARRPAHPPGNNRKHPVRQAIDFSTAKETNDPISRPRLTRGFDNPVPSATLSPLSSMPLHRQEDCLVDDLLSILLAMPARYILLSAASSTLSISFHPIATQGADSGLLALAARFFPFACNFFSIMQAVENARSMDRDIGLTKNALGAALLSSMKTYLDMIPELEVAMHAGRLSMQRMWFFIRPAARQLSFLATVAQATDQSKGSSIVAVLENMLCTVDDENRLLLDDLRAKTARPMVDFVVHWIKVGIIDDPHDEFFVEENQVYSVADLANDYEGNYWGRRYCIRTENIPTSLEPYADKLLRIGKYINVFRECGVDQVVPSLQNTSGITTVSSLIANTDLALNEVSTLLLTYFRTEVDILGRLRTIRTFFLTDHADYMIHLLSSARSNFELPTEAASKATLESLLEDAVRSSTLATDKYKEQVSCDLLPYSLLDQLLGILGEKVDKEPLVSQSKVSESFTLTFNISWPASLVLSCKSLIKYQLLFRHILRCRIVEQDLNMSWVCLYKARKGFSASPALAKALILLRRMHSFIERLLRFMNVEVLRPKWLCMEDLLSRAQSLDEVIKCHDDFLDTCLKGCMLTNSKLFRIMIRLQTTCITFCKLAERYDQDCGASSKVDSAFVANLNKAETTFDRYLVQLIEALGTYSVLEGDPNLAVFCSWLDFNGFYSTVKRLV